VEDLTTSLSWFTFFVSHNEMANVMPWSVYILCDTTHFFMLSHFGMYFATDVKPYFMTPTSSFSHDLIHLQ
jgi:hypothetical protein